MISTKMVLTQKTVVAVFDIDRNTHTPTLDAAVMSLALDGALSANGFIVNEAVIRVITEGDEWRIGDALNEWILELAVTGVNTITCTSLPNVNYIANAANGDVVLRYERNWWDVERGIAAIFVPSTMESLAPSQTVFVWSQYEQDDGLDWNNCFIADGIDGLPSAGCFVVIRPPVLAPDPPYSHQMILFELLTGTVGTVGGNMATNSFDLNGDGDDYVRKTWLAGAVTFNDYPVAHVGPGRYLFSVRSTLRDESLVFIPADGFPSGTTIGEDASGTFIDSGPVGDLYTIDPDSSDPEGTDNGSVQTYYLHVVDASSVATPNDGSQASNEHGVIVSHNVFLGAQDAAISLTRVERAVVESNHIAAGGAGVTLDTCPDALVLGNAFSGLQDEAIVVYDSDRVTIRANRIADAALAGSSPVVIGGPAGSTGVLFATNRILSAVPPAPVAILIATTAIDTAITENDLRDSSSNPALIQDGGTDSIILRNIPLEDVGGGGGGYTQEQIEDFVGAMIVGGTTISANYEDTPGTITLEVVPETISLGSLSDVHVPTPAHTNILSYNSISGRWEAVDIPDGSMVDAAAFAGNIGDGVATVFDVAHNLNSADVLLQVFEASGNRALVQPGVRIMDANTARLTFTVAPTLDQYRVVVGISGGSGTGIHNHDSAYSLIGHAHSYAPAGHTHTHEHTLDELSDVSTFGKDDGEALVWSQANNRWQPGAVSGGPASGQYRQFVWEVSGGAFTFITDEVGNPIMALESLE